MAEIPPAPALGAIQAKIEEQLRWVDSMMVGPAGEKPSVVLSGPEARALLAAYDAQAARLAAYDERERIAATLDCKTPKCPRARAVILTGPVPEPRYGAPGLFLVWWCSSCGTQWSHWERAADAVGTGEPSDAV